MTDETSASKMSDNGAEATTITVTDKRQGDGGLMWRNVSLEVDTSQGNKRILRNVWGQIPSQGLCAILGPSGAGKSSLLNALSGRIKPTSKTRISGDIWLGNKKVSSDVIKEKISYVMQDDTMFSTLNVRESLQFSYRMRVREANDEDTISKVNDMMKKLRLESCADTLVGSPLVKGISGGEKKRLAVGVELIVEPQLLFLDEPTSGLDSFSALTCIELLENIATSGTAVLCTIHQPSSEIFNKFSHTILMHAGSIVYGGLVDNVSKQFANVGRPVPARWNPADWLLFVVQSAKSDDEVKKITMQAPNDALKKMDVDDVEIGKVSSEKDASSGIELVNKKKMGGSSVVPGDVATDHRAVRRKRSIWAQIYFLFLREVRGTSRDKGYLIGRYGVTTFLFVLFGLVFMNSAGKDDTDPDNLNTHWNSVTFLCISGMFGSAQPVLLQFPYERPVFVREVSGNVYSTPAYFLSKLAVELPLSFVQALIQTTLSYFLMELQGDFILILLVFWILGLASSSVAVMLGCMLPDAKQAMECAPIIFVPQILFAGVFVQLEQVPVFLRWVQWTCSLKYAVNLFSLVEFADCDLPGCDARFEDNDIDTGDAWVWNAGALFGLFVVFRVIGFVFLDYSAKYVF